MIARLLLWLTLLCLPAASHALTLDERFDDPAKEARAVELFKRLRCVVCEGQSVHESNADLAQDVRAHVRRRIDEDLSDAQILNLLEQRYGASILMRPPHNEHTFLLWYGPLGLLLTLFLGYFGLWYYQRSRS